MMEPAQFQQTVLDALASLKADLADLDKYVRNHLTSQMAKQFEELDTFLISRFDGVDKAITIFQDHEH